MATNKGLGKGFDILMPKGFSVSNVTAGSDERIHKLSIDTIVPRSDQPRKHFDQLQLEQLARSISEQGILQPIVVVKNEQNMYTIIAGERRWRASQIAGLNEMPAIVREASEHQQLEMALLENVQRADLSSFEQALTVVRLHEQFNQSYEEIAQRLGKAYTSIINLVRLLALPEYILKAFEDRLVTEGHARSILALQKNPKEQKKLFDLILRKGISVRQAEQFVVSAKKNNEQVIDKTAKSKISDGTIKKSVQQIGIVLGAKTLIQHSKRGSGKLVINYKNEEELNVILNKMKKLS